MRTTGPVSDHRNKFPIHKTVHHQSNSVRIRNIMSLFAPDTSIMTNSCYFQYQVTVSNSHIIGMSISPKSNISTN